MWKCYLLFELPIVGEAFNLWIWSASLCSSLYSLVTSSLRPKFSSQQVFPDTFCDRSGVPQVVSSDNKTMTHHAMFKLEGRVNVLWLTEFGLRSWAATVTESGCVEATSPICQLWLLGIRAEVSYSTVSATPEAKRRYETWWRLSWQPQLDRPPTKFKLTRSLGTH
jgi:hypothetical protein